MYRTLHARNVCLAFINLMRLRIVGMVLVSTAIGFVLSCQHVVHLPLLLCTLLGTGLLSGGACALNCYAERDLDAVMSRTCNRPIPAGIISPSDGLIFGLAVAAAGSVLLFWKVNALAGALGLVALFIYIVIYTPAKRLTWLNTSIGSLPGAIPPLIGSAAGGGFIGPGGWILFGMLFIWQHTHFLPIAWLFREDYRKAGFRMLPVLEQDGQKTFGLTLITAVILLPVSLLLCRFDLAGSAYGCAAALLGALLIIAAVQLHLRMTRRAARAVLFLSLCYLPVVLAAVLLDRYGGPLANHCHEWLGIVWQWT